MGVEATYALKRVDKEETGNESSMCDLLTGVQSTLMHNDVGHAGNSHLLKQ